MKSKVWGVKQFLIGAILGLGLISILFGVFFVFTPSVGIEKQDSKDIKNKVKPVFDWDNDTEAYNYWYAPENSFGIESTKTINWSFFKQKFTQHTDWLLQYKRYSWSEWTNGNQYLTIGKTWNETGFWKINLTFYAPVDIYDARFIFSCDLPVLKYIEKDDYEVWINYSFNATEKIQLMFNWSDLQQYQNLYYQKGVQNDKFFFLFGRQNIPAGEYVFDPIFGNSGSKSNQFNFDGYIIALKGTPTGGDGTVDNITASIYSGGAIYQNVTCCLYTYVADNDASAVIAITETKTWTNAQIPEQWHVFNFSDPKPTITNNTNYFIGIVSNDTGNSIFFNYEGVGGSKIVYENVHDGVFEDPLVGESAATTEYMIYCSYTEDTGLSWSLISSDKNGSWVNTTTHQLISSDKNGSWTNSTITFNFISMTPSNILINSTGELLITYNLTTINTGLNRTSLLIAHVLNNTRTLHLNNTYTLYAENWVPDKKCAINRNYPYWFENEFSYLTGDNTIGDIGEWAVHNETLYENITINSQGSNWINFTHNISILENLFGNIFLVNREAQTIEDKTGQIFSVYKNRPCKVAFNMSNTQWWNDTEYNNTYYTLHFYAEDVSADKDLFVYYANDSYVSGDPLISPFCELIGAVGTGRGYDYTVLNSSYYDISFSSDENGTIGSVGMTNNFSFIFASTAKDSTHKWNVYYADDNITILGEYHDFKNSTSSMTSIDKGTTWVNQDGTIDCFLTYGHLGNIDRIQYKVYCQMNGVDTGNGQWSSVIVDVLDETNLPPNIPNVITPNGTVTDYSIGDIINITYSWLGDPNLDTCWLNITVDDTDENVVHWVQNRSIDSDEYEINNTWWYNWDTVGLSQGGPYHVNITVTDPYGLFRYTGLDGVFWLNLSWSLISSDKNGSWVNTTTHQLVSNDKNGSWINTTVWSLISSDKNGSWVNTSIGLNWVLVSSDKNGSWVNTTTYQIVSSDKNGTWVNDTITWNIVSNDKNGTWTNTTEVFFTITSVYPGNNSDQIPLQPYAFATITYLGSESSFNVSWYNSSGLINTDTNLANGTHNELFINATVRITDYTLWIRCDDGTNWENQSFSFTTEGFGGASSPNRDMWMLSALLLLIPFVFIIISKRKKEGEN